MPWNWCVIILHNFNSNFAQIFQSEQNWSYFLRPEWKLITLAAHLELTEQKIWWLAYLNWHFLGQISHYVSVFISISNITVFLWGFPCGLRLLPVKGFCSTIPEVYQINAAWGGWLNGKANAKWFHTKNNLHSPVRAAADIFASLNQSDGHFLFAFVPKG